MRLKVLWTVALLFAVSAVAQTSVELKAKYPSIEVYAVRPDVWLIPKFAVDGQQCELSLEKRNYGAFSKAEIDELTNELLPVSTRGAEKKYLGSDSYIAGGASAIEHVFENNVSIIEYGAVNSGVSRIAIRWNNRPCAKVKSDSTNLSSSR